MEFNSSSIIRINGISVCRECHNHIIREKQRAGDDGASSDSHIQARECLGKCKTKNSSNTPEDESEEHSSCLMPVQAVISAANEGFLCLSI